jgi:glucose 1-dehydrogenase
MSALPATALREVFGLSHAVALITGAASGLGRACALLLGQAGAHVAVNHLPGSAAAAAAVCRDIEAAGGQAMAVAADVSQQEEVEAMLRQVVDRFGRLDILVANAGIENGAPFQDMTLQQWQQVIDVNLTGTFLCARAAIRQFLRQPPQPGPPRANGRIVCMSSVHQIIPWAFQANYATSKAGVAMLARTLAQEFGPQRIRVNAVAPGAIRTDINRPVWETQAALEELLTLIPYGRIGEPRDVAQAVLFLVSDLSDYVTGATLYVGGGMTDYAAFRGAG